MTTPAVDIRGLVMRYGDKVAVDGLDLTVQRGTITAVLGPNGAGKTTTLETCEGYRRPQVGTVRVLGLDPVKDRRELLPRIGVMLQSGGAWSGVRAEEMLRHIGALHANPVPIGLLMERLQLHECGRTPYRRLSGGQQQRLGLAMAVVGRPELLFVDEPTAGMDPAVRRTTWELLEELRTAGATIVLTTHYLNEAERLADQVHVIDKGTMIASGTPDQLTQGRGQASVRVVLDLPLPDGAGAALTALLGPEATLTQTASAVEITGPADHATLSRISTWCAEHELLPRSLVLGRQSLEDVFLQLTGQESA